MEVVVGQDVVGRAVAFEFSLFVVVVDAHELTLARQHLRDLHLTLLVVVACKRKDLGFTCASKVKSVCGSDNRSC